MKPEEVLLNYITLSLILLSFVSFSVVLAIKMRMARRGLENKVLRARIEEQDHTMQTISREIHDNLGQRLSLLFMSVKMVRKPNIEDKEEILDLAEDLITKLILDTNNFSRSLSIDFARENSLYTGIMQEADRINRLNRISCNVLESGVPKPFPVETKYSLLRIFQEVIGNACKHSEANHITVKLDYQPEKLVLSIEDDGKGFDPLAINGNGMGLENMQFRAKEIGASFELKSAPGQGTLVKLII